MLDDPPGHARRGREFRVTSWKLNKDYSIEIAGRTTADEMYDLTVGPKPADVVAEPVPTEQVIDLVPGDVVAFNGQPFAMTVDTSDTKLAVVDVEYAPPAPLGVFAGISGYLDDGERVQALGDHDYAGGPGNGHARFVIPLGDAPGNWRLYLASRSSVYKKPLVPYGNDGATPSRTLSVPARGSDYIPPEPPTLPTAISASEHVNERVKDANALVSTPIYVTVNLPAGSNAEWVSVWVTAYSGSGYDWVGKWYVGETVKFWRLAPTGSTQWKVKVTTGKGDGENSPETALESAPFPVAGIGNAAANGITNAAAGAVTYKLSDDGTYTWGISAVTWTLPNAATDVNAWSSALTVQKVNSAGNPATDYEGQEREVVEDDRMGQTVTWPIANWTIPSPSSPYRTFRFRLYLFSRNETRVLQACWPGGATYCDVTPSSQPGALNAGRMDPSTLGAAVGLAGNKLQVNIGPGLGTSYSNQVQVNPGAGIQISANLVAVQPGSGLGFSGNQLTVVIGAGLQITLGQVAVNPSTGLKTSGSQLIVDVGIGITTSGNQITVSVGAGLSTSGNQVVIPTNAVTKDMIYQVKAESIQSGTIDVSSALTFSGSGGIQMFNGGDINVNPGSVGAYSYNAFYGIAYSTYPAYKVKGNTVIDYGQNGYFVNIYSKTESDARYPTLATGDARWAALNHTHSSSFGRYSNSPAGDSLKGEICPYYDGSFWLYVMVYPHICRIPMEIVS